MLEVAETAYASPFLFPARISAFRRPLWRLWTHPAHFRSGCGPLTDLSRCRITCGLTK